MFGPALTRRAWRQFAQTGLQTSPPPDAGAPLDISPGQVYVLSDSDILQTAMPPQKGVVETAIKIYKGYAEYLRNDVE